MESYKVGEEIIIIAIDDEKYLPVFTTITWIYQNNKIKLIKQLTLE